MPASPPIPQARLQEIVQQACESVLSNVSSYNHADVDKQNGQIISTILNALVSSSSTTITSSSSPQYKFAVNSTIIQHLSDPSPSTSNTTSTNTGTHTTSGHALATQPPNSHASSAAAAAQQAGQGTTTGAPADALGANEADARTASDVPVAGLDGSGIGANGTGSGSGSGNGNVMPARGVKDASAGAASSQAPTKGRRGMHSATGAYWNEETDGMWSWKYDGGAERGMDVVVSVVWVGV